MWAADTLSAWQPEGGLVPWRIVAPKVALFASTHTTSSRLVSLLSLLRELDIARTQFNLHLSGN